ncbi:MAG: hypothetical protein MN733_05985, partial [Nitrososphaera sp.]|nr:hypothetical protein [Nitrososphaera sp.]
MDELVLYRSEADRLRLVCETAQIQTKEDYITAGDIVVRAGRENKVIEEKRLSLTRPLDDAKRGIMDMFKPLLEVRRQAIESLTLKMRAWDKKQKERQAAQLAEARRLEEEAKRLEEGKKGEALAINQAAAMLRDVDIYKVSGLSSAKLWYARVTDFDALLRAVLDG